MTFYQNFADGIHIKEEKIDIKRLYEIQDKFENIRYTKTLFFVKPGKNLLEIGAGRGGFARLCKDKQINYFGIEPEYTLFKKLKEEGFSVENSKVPPISHKTGFFDYVTHFHVIEHLKDGEEVYKFFVEIKVLDNIYPRISYLLGKVWKKNTELFYICEKK